MSATFQVNTERIQAASGDIASISAELESLVATMLSRLTALQDAWTGSAATRFHAVVHEWRGTQQQVRASLDSICARPRLPRAGGIVWRSDRDSGDCVPGGAMVSREGGGSGRCSA